MPKYGGQSIYGKVYGAMPKPSLYGTPSGPACPVIDCSQVEDINNYIIQLTNILGNLERNKKIPMADAALDIMTASISDKIADSQ